MWVIAESKSCGEICGTAYELIAKALKLSESSGTGTAAVCVGVPDANSLNKLKSSGVDCVYVSNTGSNFFEDERFAESIAVLSRKYKPSVILGPATARGRALMPRIAVKLKTGLTADCTGLEIQAESGKLLQTRPAFGGNLLATIICESFPQMATVRPHVFAPNAPQSTGKTAEFVEFDASESWPSKRIISETPFENKGENIADAQIVVCAGMGVGNSEGIKKVETLAKKLGGALAGSRPVVDNGLLEYSRQVGQTGTTVHPNIYIACGVSGSVQHLAGMQGSDFIIAINSDPDAHIMKIADIALCGDLNDIVPELITVF
ncbi:MAG: hypothetical protein A2020_09620 [Lentisphaerae bacterium GWF2_45_14]|nr:MAG: hypothetical protein A2020_09620 [Lentisphaerae bacterium GWF2_45_14]